MTGSMTSIFILLLLQRSLCIRTYNNTAALASIPTGDYSRNTIETIESLMHGEKPRSIIDHKTFYELLGLINSNVYDYKLRVKSYSGLVAHGLLGEHSHSEAITSFGPADDKIKLAIKAIKPEWWYVILAQIANQFGIGMAIDGATVVLSNEPVCCDLIGVDFDKIKTFKYSMSIDMNKKVGRCLLSDALVLIFGRLGAICELEFVNGFSKNLDPRVFTRVFGGFRAVTVLKFPEMTGSSFHEIISDFNLEDIKALHIPYIPLAGNFSFIEKLDSLERLFIAVHGPTSAFLDALPQPQKLTRLDLRGNNFSDSLDFAFVAKLESLVKLAVSFCALTPESLETLARVKVPVNLTELDLSSNCYPDLPDFAFIASFTSLVRLDLSNSGLTPAFLDALSKINTHRTLCELCLWQNSLSDSSNLAFIAKFPSLVKLDLSSCKFTSEFLRTLSKIEPPRNLRILDLSSNYFHDLSNLSLLTSLSSLEKLNLTYCGLTSTSLDTLSKIDTLKNLRTLNLSRNDFSGSDSLSPEFFANFSSLVKLGLSRCELTSSFLDALSKIDTHRTLRKLDLSCNRFTDLNSLNFAFVTELPSLVKLVLSGCGLTPASLRIFSAIEPHNSLTELNLSQNDFSNSGSLSLEFVRKLPALKMLDLSKSELTSESKSWISELMGERVHL